MFQYTIAIPLSIYNINKVIFKEQSSNKILPNSTFCKVMYSTQDCHITNIPLYINLHEQPNHTKYKYYIDKDKSKQIISQIKELEEKLLHKYNNTMHTKIPNYKLTNQMLRGMIKLHDENTKSNNFIIKIIGIWETQYEYGITYKISNHL
tara:strand:+ start:3084 stop:3533 length:450 start_codon:yes stop_codon:yes gene_type:complete